MISSALAERSALSLSAMNCVPALPVLAPKPPTFDTTCATSGSARTIAFICSWRAFIAGYEMSCGPRVLPMIMPVSCCGN